MVPLDVYVGLLQTAFPGSDFLVLRCFLPWEFINSLLDLRISRSSAVVIINFPYFLQNGSLNDL